MGSISAKTGPSGSESGGSAVAEETSPETGNGPNACPDMFFRTNWYYCDRLHTICEEGMYTEPGLRCWQVAARACRVF